MTQRYVRLRDVLAIKEFDDGADFVEDLFEPEFKRLMRDNEQHLLMGWSPLLVALGMLGVQERVELEIVRVIDHYRMSSR